MYEYESLSHTKWECKYHVVFNPKCLRKTLYADLRKYLGEVFRKLAARKESRIEEGHLMRDHVRGQAGSAITRRNSTPPPATPGIRDVKLPITSKHPVNTVYWRPLVNAGMVNGSVSCFSPATFCESFAVFGHFLRFWNPFKYATKLGINQLRQPQAAFRAGCGRVFHVINHNPSNLTIP